uniref:Large ribosomal subunit protein mL53 n=1 Tax=Panagrellus redivivus TaxID=6233 RepID=A0A7E4VAZ7_PANRE
MCRMWQSIRAGVRWRPVERFALSVRAINLKDVNSVHISLDPFHHDTNSLRYFWHAITSTKVKMTNPRVKVTTEIRNDGQAPFFVADLADKRKLVFKTAGMEPMDVVIRFNKLTGNPELGNAGLRTVPQ